MKKSKTLLTLCLVALVLTSCSKQNNESTATNAPASTEVATTDMTEDKTEAPTKEPTESPTEKAKEVSSTSLEEYLKDYTDSKTHHLLYDVALNEDAATNMDNDVTYMFPEDDNGNRTIGEVIAYYSDFKKIEAKNADVF